MDRKKSLVDQITVFKYVTEIVASEVNLAWRGSRPPEDWPDLVAAHGEAWERLRAYLERHEVK